MRFKLFSERTTLFLFVFLFAFNGFGQTRVKAMFYNLLNYEDNQVSRDKTVHLTNILNEVSPDLFMVCELEEEEGSDYLFANAVLTHNSGFKKAEYQTSNASISLNQMVYYNSNKLILENQRVIPTTLRDINHYTFRLNTINSSLNPIRLEVFVTHLKASQGIEERFRRLLSVEEFVDELDNIPQNSYVLFAGDFNFYSSNEEGYQLILNENNSIKIIDPINRPNDPFPNTSGDPFDTFFPSNSNDYFWRSSTYSDIHSQSTRISSSMLLNGEPLIDDSGAGGGLDDRFDFIMMSKNFTTSSELFYVNNSYETIGNFGDCYNNSINDSDCRDKNLTEPEDIQLDEEFRTSLLQFSDHLPIVLEIETPENTLSTSSYTTNITLPRGNIVDGSLEIQISNTLNNQVKTLYVFDIKGRKLIEQKVNSNNLTISTQALSTGIYYLSINLNSKPVKFVKK